MGSRSPVLLITFNRPDLTARVVAEVVSANPPAIYVASDGGRTASEWQIVERTREHVLGSVPGHIPVTTLFQDVNLGCKAAVEAALSWFFESVDEGIVLEDDCVPSPSFFDFCDQMLERYRHDSRIMHVGGYHQGPEVTGSYLYSQYPTVWGWASWRRAWSLYESRPLEISPHSERCITPGFGSNIAARYVVGKVNEIANGELDTWDYLWSYALITNRGLAVQALTNLVANVGVGDPRAAHTLRARPDVDSNSARRFDGTWTGPDRVFPSYEHDRQLFNSLMTTRQGRAAMWLPPRLRAAVRRLVNWR